MWEILPQNLVMMESDHGQWWKQAPDNAAARPEDDWAARQRSEQRGQEVAFDLLANGTRA